MKKQKDQYLEINLSIKYHKIKHFINRQIPDIQVIEKKYPISIIVRNLNEMVDRMVEKFNESFNLQEATQ